MIETIQELAAKILKHKKLYYLGKPEISDQEFDAMEDQLRRLQPEHPVLSVVGSEEIAPSSKVEHDRPMLSLNKTYLKKDLFNWMDKLAVVGTLKVDGNSLSLIYEDGLLQLGKTRGNGRIGEDVTIKTKWVASIPKVIDRKDKIEVRGELYCGDRNFAKLCQEMESRKLERPSSPRNIVAGILGRKQDYDLANYFSFFAFDLIEYSDSSSMSTEMEKFSRLSELGFTVPRYQLIQSEGEAEQFLDSVLEEMENGSVSLDGAVFTYDNLNLHEELGVTSHHPRFKLSFKWQGQTATSKIQKIHWATSRHGIVTPVAVIEPVELSGAKITNITLHNAAMVSTYNLKVGDQIELVRSGEVIPKFLRVVEEAKGSYHWPQNCPACHEILTFDDVRLICPNTESCSAQQTGQILNWIKSVGIDDLSEKRLEHMMDIGFVSSIPDLYHITMDDMLQLPLTKDKMARKLHLNIQKSKNLTLIQFLKGLGISGAGTTTWEKIVDIFPDLNLVRKMTAEELVAIDGFAEKSSLQIVQGLTDKSPLIDQLLAAGVAPKTVVQTQNTGPKSLAGMLFVITGSLSRPRSEIEKDIKSAGGKVTGSVSTKTTAVITNDTDSSSSKMKKAIELNIPVWSETVLLEKINI